MFKSYFKIAWRNILKERQFTMLNLIGLATGLACTLLIYLWVNDELKVDKYNKKDDRLYQVMVNTKNENGIKTWDGTPGLLAKALKDEIPEVENSVSILPASWFPHKGVISYNDKPIKAGGQYVDKDFFKVFTCQYIEGDQNSLFANKNAIAISEDLATKLFSSTQNIIGKTVTWNLDDMGGTCMVTGIFKKNPANATMQYDVLLNYALALERRPFWLDFNNSDPNAYIIVKNETNIAKLNNKIEHFLDSKKKDKAGSIFLYKYSDRYLYGKFENGVPAGGRITYVKLFSAIALFILLIACINFMNLSTARASKRTKEVGIKKVVGALRGELVMQYLGESMLMSFLSLAIAVVFVVILLPQFNALTGKSLALYYDVKLISAALAITIFTGFIAGSYPAFYLSGFKPVTVLKGKLSVSIGELWARKSLVVFQFTLSAMFIAAVLIVYRQIDFIQSKNLGYERDHIIHFEIPLEQDEAKLKASVAFADELKKIPGVVSVGSYYHNLTGDHGGISGVEWPGKNPTTDLTFANLEVGFGFLETMKIRLKEGRDYSKNESARKEIIFNEAAIQAMGLKDPVGKKIKFWGEEKTIIGVAQNFNFESLYENLKPCFFQEYPIMPNIMVRIETGTEKQTIAQIEKTYLLFNKGLVFDYKFLDEDYQALYASENRVSVLSRNFAGLAILISCLGLFGVAAFTAQRRQKEIGIRKVVGASVGNLAFLLSKEFLKLVLIAVIIAFPLVWWGMTRWLADFNYHITIGADIFLMTGSSALLITLLTVSFQAFKAALMNPVKSLRTE